MLVYRIAAIISRPFVWFVFRPRVRGREHLPARGGFVLCPTHLSGFDTVAAVYAMRTRPLRSMAKNQLFRRPLLGPLVLAMGAFPAHDGDSFPGGVAAAADLAARGNAVLIFPEGRRRRDRESHLYTGAARTALEAGVPLVPMALRGTDGWRRLHRWQIAFGPPISVVDLAERESAGAAGTATSRLWDAIRTLELSLSTIAGEPATPPSPSAGRIRT